MALPMSHVYGILSMNIGVVTGAVTIYLERFDAAAALAAIEEYRIERASLVPAMLVGLIDCPERERYDTSSLKNVTSGSAPLSEEVRLEFQRLYDCRVANGYGQSEASCVVTAYRDEELVRPGSCGRVLPGITIRVIDRTGRVTHVIVGDYQKIVIPDLAGYRLAPGRLKGLRCVHTHLTEEAFWESLDLFHGPVWASHCNCRALVNRQRQLSDRQLRALFDRNAVIGLLRPDIGKDAVLKTK
jgi:acyl-CoA synthetase (AMP-forming)/AMP-acid ligase II